jgi:hypothetical protein
MSRAERKGGTVPTSSHFCAGDAMARRWGDLSDRTRKLIGAAAVAEAILKAVALADLWRRPASQVRGSKWAWLPALVVSSAGIGPISYFVFGRRRETAS